LASALVGYARPCLSQSANRNVKKTIIGERHHENNLRDLPGSALPVRKRTFDAAAGFIFPAVPRRKARARFNAGLVGPTSDHDGFALSSIGQVRVEITFIVPPATYIHPQLLLDLLAIPLPV